MRRCPDSCRAHNERTACVYACSQHVVDRINLPVFMCLFQPVSFSIYTKWPLVCNTICTHNRVVDVCRQDLCTRLLRCSVIFVVRVNIKRTHIHLALFHCEHRERVSEKCLNVFRPELVETLPTHTYQFTPVLFMQLLYLY
jgi:hypothetical protein